MITKKLILISLVVLVFSLVFSSMVLAYNEAPELAEKVASGELPPVDKRLPENPRVIDPVEESGQYSDYALRAAEREYDDTFSQVTRFFPVGDKLARWNLDRTEMMPQLAEDWEIEIQDKLTILTINLRKGVKWSDGHPLTADDYIFWWEDMYKYNPDPELTEVEKVGSLFRSEKEVIEIEKIDDYTLKVTAKGKYPTIWGLMTDIAGLKAMPEHYIKQIHPKYNPDQEMDEMEQYEEFSDQFDGHGHDWPFAALTDPEFPVLSPWKATGHYLIGEEITFVRNPYYYKVDPKGNQLPYLNNLKAVYLPNPEVRLLQLQSGEVDFDPAAAVDPMLWTGQKSGDYSVIEWQIHRSNTMYENYNYPQILERIGENKEKIEVSKLMYEPKFRKALMLGVDNKLLAEGWSPFNYELSHRWLKVGSPQREWPELEEAINKSDELYELKIDKANELLDELGLERGSDNWRKLEVDGKKVDVAVEILVFSAAAWIEEITGMYKKQIEENLGVKVHTKSAGGGLVWETVASGEYQFFSFGDGGAQPFTNPGGPQWGNYYPEFLNWINTNGREGIEPDPETSHGARFLKVYEIDEEIRKTADQEKLRELIVERINVTVNEYTEIFKLCGQKYYPMAVNNKFGNAAKVVKGNKAFYGGKPNIGIEQYYIKN